MPVNAQKVLPPFDWTQLEPTIQTKILEHAKRRFVIEHKHYDNKQTLCFERPMGAKHLQAVGLTITFTGQLHAHKYREWTNVFQIKMTCLGTSQGITEGWRFQFYCKNKPGTTQINIYAVYIEGNFARKALITGLTGSLNLRHRRVGSEEDEFSI